MVESVQVGDFELVKFRQIFIYLGKDKISKAGFRWLSKSSWKKLDHI
jgi:hypothetical protein